MDFIIGRPCLGSDWIIENTGEMMNYFIITLSVIGVLFFIMHEYEACYYREWKMFRFLNKLNKETQAMLFVYLHLPLTLFMFYYLWTVINLSNIVLWIILNSLLILHLIIHLIALKWKSNVFHSIHSFIFIAGAALTGLISLFLVMYY